MNPHLAFRNGPQVDETLEVDETPVELDPGWVRFSHEPISSLLDLIASFEATAKVALQELTSMQY